MSAVRLAVLIAVCGAGQALAQTPVPHDSARPYRTSLELSLGSYLPKIDSEPGLKQPGPYASTFNGSMLLFQAEVDRFLWQKYGSLGVGFAVGYAEKYGRARDAGDQSVTKESTSLHVLPLRLLAVYRLDYGALHWNIPLVPFAKVGLAFTPWWADKGDGVETANAHSGSGGKWGYSAVGGLALMLDFLEPDLARDLSTDTGIQHTYLMAEYVHDAVPSFGGGGLNLSADHWLFSLAFDF